MSFCWPRVPVIRVPMLQARAERFCKQTRIALPPPKNPTQYVLIVTCTSSGHFLAMKQAQHRWLGLEGSIGLSEAQLRACPGRGRQPLSSAQTPSLEQDDKTKTWEDAAPSVHTRRGKGSCRAGAPSPHKCPTQQARMHAHGPARTHGLLCTEFPCRVGSPTPQTRASAGSAGMFLRRSGDI